MWLVTENPWPVMVALSIIAVALVVLWRSRQDNRLLVAAGVSVLLVIGAC